MPEGPEIRPAADLVATVLLGRPLAGVQFAFERLKPFEDELRGQRVEAVDTQGKSMLTRFESRLTLYSHDQLFGRWYVVSTGEDPRLKEIESTSRGSRRLYLCSRCQPAPAR